MKYYHKRNQVFVKFFKLRSRESLEIKKIKKVCLLKINIDRESKNKIINIRKLYF